MSLIDLASLVLAPTATKEGKVYSAIPDTGDGDMTFSRGSGATRINSAGLIEKERSNLLLQSNTFDTTWVASGTISATSGQSGYDGTSDAWLLDKGSASAYIYQSISNSGVATFSCYVKAGTTDWFRVRINTTSATQSCFYDLTNGVIGTDTSIESKMELIGGGWYRCILTLNATTTEVRLYPADGNLDLSGTSGNILIQDAMLNDGLVAQSYIETTTTAVYEGITDDVPRVDYSGGGCPSLLLEPQRTNLLTQSEYFGGWDVYRGTLTANDATSPEGVDNAYRYEENSDTGQHFVRKTISMTSGTTYTASAFVKADEITSVKLGSSNTGNWNASATFNLSNGSVSSGTGTIENYGNNWYRCIVTANCTTTASIGLEITTSSGVGSSGDGLYIYGAMIEAGTYSTSYIPTYSVSSTRVADECSKTGISELIGQTEGTLFYEFNVENINSQTNDPVLVYLRGTGTESYLQLKDTGRLDAVYYTSGATQCRLQKIISEGTHKVAFAYKANDFIMYIDGVFAASDTSGAIGTLNEFGLQYYNSTYFGQQKVNQAILFPTRLTNTELADLTTI